MPVTLIMGNTQEQVLVMLGPYYWLLHFLEECTIIDEPIDPLQMYHISILHQRMLRNVIDCVGQCETLSCIDVQVCHIIIIRYLKMQHSQNAVYAAP